MLGVKGASNIREIQHYDPEADSKWSSARSRQKDRTGRSADQTLHQRAKIPQTFPDPDIGKQEEGEQLAVLIASKPQAPRKPRGRWAELGGKGCLQHL